MYALTSQFPSSETYRLTQQLTRAVASVPANIAEGHARSTPKDYGHFLAIAQGSLAETETFVLLAVRLRYLTEASAQPVLSLIEEIGKMLSTIRSRLRSRT